MTPHKLPRIGSGPRTTVSFFFEKEIQGEHDGDETDQNADVRVAEVSKSKRSDENSHQAGRQ
jgi:hypothetical protein